MRTARVGDLKALGAVLDKDAGLIVLYATNMADQIAASMKAENRYISDAIDANADELASSSRRQTAAEYPSPAHEGQTC